MLYIINEFNTDKYKIGKTTNLKKRLRSLQCGNSNELYVCYTFNTRNDNIYELQLHEHFKKKLIRGEWFKFEDLSIVINYIDTLSDIKVDYKF